MKPSINFDVPARFLKRLDPVAEVFTFQTFDDNKLRRKVRDATIKAEVDHIRKTVPPDLQAEAIKQVRYKNCDPLARIIEGSFDDVKDQLAELNRQGAGIFVTLNRTKLDGTRNAKSITSVRSLCADLDGAPLAPVESFPLKPHMIVETSSGRYHAYWIVEGLPLNEFSVLQKAIAERFNADPSICDLPRVVRVPGFFHNKGE